VRRAASAFEWNLARAKGIPRPGVGAEQRKPQRRDNLSELEIAQAFLNELLSADLFVKLYIFASGL
jgi:hypothetical protein